MSVTALAAPVRPVTVPPLSAAEQQAEEDYQRSTANLVSEGKEWESLKTISSRTPEQEARYQQLSDQLSQASVGLKDYYQRLYVLFGKSRTAKNQVDDVDESVDSLRQQIAKMPNTVALYTMVTGDHYSVVVITGATMVARESSIPEKDLNQKVAAFQQVLRDPAKDPRPLAEELYKILIGPVKADLDQAQATTLVWSLDGVLRYISMAALYDGKQYLVEKYNTATITPVSIPYLSEKPDVSSLSAVAMGISRKYEDGLNSLPGVSNELYGIVKDPLVKDSHGILPGTILLNDRFTEKAMEEQLNRGYSVVHIATHFVFEPGDDNQSYLLLAGKSEAGAGYHLTVAEFRNNPNLSLKGIELLTLSACSFDVGKDGREVEGFATVAQLKGAKSVLLPIWPADDNSTGDLMADFYKRWSDGGGKVMKVEALRQTQLDLLTGKVAPKRDYTNPNAPTSYAHSYYWAPFVLMENWK